MAHDHPTDDFDWVSAQSTCNAAAMFARLLTGVREDIRRRNALLGRQDGWKFELAGEDDEFEVSRLAGHGPAGGKVLAFVSFTRAGQRIHVRGDGVDLELTAIVTLDTTGACRFVVGEAMYSDWEIRRMALELLFFADDEDLE
jgi:hypothetical protein